MSRGRCQQQLDGLIRATPNIPRALNGALLWAEEEGSLPYNNLTLPHIMVAPDWPPGTSRYWDTTKGPLRITIKAFLPTVNPHDPEVLDAACQNELLIAGHGSTDAGSGIWNLGVRHQFVGGVYEYHLAPELLPGTGRGVVYVFKDVNQVNESPGCMAEFCWGPGPGVYVP